MKILSATVYLLLAATVLDPHLARAGDDAFGALLEGEFALQDGDFHRAAIEYVTAAEASDDPALADRAAHIALLGDDLALSERAVSRWRTLQPDAAELPQAEARLALKRGDADVAVTVFRELLQQSDGWRAAIQALATSGEREAATPVLRRLVETDSLPSSFDAWLAFGGLAQRMGEPDIGPMLAARAIERFPEDARAWLWSAEEAQRAKQPDKARAAIDKAIALGPLDTSTRLAIAAQLDGLGDPEAAAAALATGEQDDTTLAGRAAYLARTGDDAALTEIYELAAADAKDASPERLYLLGQLSELLEQSEQALQWYGRVPDGLQREQAQLRIAVLLDKADRLEEALGRLHELQASDSEYGELLRDSYLLEAELLLRRERSGAGLDALERGLKIFEDDPELIYARALAFERLDRVAEAEADLRRLVDQDPDNADALNALGYTLADRTDRYEEALALIQRALELKPDTPAIVDSHGWVLYRMGRVGEALPLLRRAFELQRDAEVAAHLGEVLWVSGEKEEARSILRLGREIDPDNRVLKQTLKRIEE